MKFIDFEKLAALFLKYWDKFLIDGVSYTLALAAITVAFGAVFVWGDRIFEKCGIRRDEEGDGGKTLEIRGKRRLSARDGGANYQQS